MEFLINPNVSYVLLVIGFIFAILALLTPGTGFIEAAALLVLALAGYGIMNMPFNPWAFPGDCRANSALACWWRLWRSFWLVQCSFTRGKARSRRWTQS